MYIYSSGVARNGWSFNPNRMYPVGIPETKKLGPVEGKRDREIGGGAEEGADACRYFTTGERERETKGDRSFALNAADEKRACYSSRDCAFHYTTLSSTRNATPSSNWSSATAIVECLN